MDQGFIVHPFETSDGQYDAGYGSDLNKTMRGFKTLREAKAYLVKHGMKTAVYDNPSGARVINLMKKKVVSRKPRANPRKDKLKLDIFRDISKGMIR